MLATCGVPLYLYLSPAYLVQYCYQVPYLTCDWNVTIVTIVTHCACLSQDSRTVGHITSRHYTYLGSLQCLLCNRFVPVVAVCFTQNHPIRLHIRNYTNLLADIILSLEEVSCWNNFRQITFYSPKHFQQKQLIVHTVRT